MCGCFIGRARCRTSASKGGSAGPRVRQRRAISSRRGAATVKGIEWPEREHGIYVDYKDNVWIGGNNAKSASSRRLKPVNDDQILKFTRTGKFRAAVGHSDQAAGTPTPATCTSLRTCLSIRRTNELFVADGYGNHRVIVFDADTGAFKRMWGAFGESRSTTRWAQPLCLGARKAAGRSTSTPSISCVCPTTVSCTWQTEATTGFRCSRSMASSCPAVHHAGAKGLTHGQFAFSPDPQQTLLYVGGQPEIWVLNRSRSDTWVGRQSERAPVRGRLEGKHLHGRNGREPIPQVRPEDLADRIQPIGHCRVRSRVLRARRTRQET